MVRAAIHPPLVVGGTHHVDRGLPAQHGKGVVAHIGLEHMPPHGPHGPITAHTECNATALARVVGDLGVRAKGGPAIARDVAVNGGPPVAGFAAHLRGGFQVPFVDPYRVQDTFGIEAHGLEAVGDDLAVGMHCDRCRKMLPPVHRAQQPHIARIGLGQRLGVGNQHRALGAKNQFGMVFAVGRDRIARRIQHARCAPAQRRCALRCRRVLHKQAPLAIEACQPQRAIGRHRDPHPQRRAGLAGHALCGCGGGRSVGRWRGHSCCRVHMLGPADAAAQRQGQATNPAPGGLQSRFRSIHVRSYFML